MRCAVRPTESADKKPPWRTAFRFLAPRALAAMAGALRDRGSRQRQTSETEDHHRPGRGLGHRHRPAASDTVQLSLRGRDDDAVAAVVMPEKAPMPLSNKSTTVPPPMPNRSP